MAGRSTCSGQTSPTRFDPTRFGQGLKGVRSSQNRHFIHISSLIPMDNIRLPSSIGLDTAAYERLYLSIHGEHNNMAVVAAGIDVTKPKPANHKTISRLFDSIARTFVTTSRYAGFNDHTDIEAFFDHFSLSFAELDHMMWVMFGHITSHERDRRRCIKLIDVMVSQLHLLIRLLQDVNEYNQKRRDLGLDAVEEVDIGYEKVLAAWPYRLDGSEYNEAVKEWANPEVFGDANEVVKDRFPQEQPEGS